jgi:hypothetical protein
MYFFYFVPLLNYIQGVFEIPVLILTRNRACEMKRFFYLNFLRKSVTNWFKISNKLIIKMYTLCPRQKFSVWSKKLHYYRNIYK